MERFELVLSVIHTVGPSIYCCSSQLGECVRHDVLVCFAVVSEYVVSDECSKRQAAVVKPIAKIRGSVQRTISMSVCMDTLVETLIA